MSQSKPNPSGHYAEIDCHWTGQCEARLDGNYLGIFASERDARMAILAEMRRKGFICRDEQAYIDAR